MTTPSSPTLACLVIDDPLLQPRYGCLEYRSILQAMKDHNFFTEIAFIPYNWRRSHPKTVELFLENPEFLAICVHGCNHTNSEFGAGGYTELYRLATLALNRMDRHTQQTGLGYDRVMVFPKGRFTTTAIQAIKDAGYVAAFNSTLRPRDGEDPPASEFALPATRHFHQFPVFLRHYPKARDALQRDFEAGRPLIIVEHHGAFRGGYRSMTDFVDWINQLGDIRWTSLDAIAKHYLDEPESELGSTSRMPQKQLSTPDNFDYKIALRRRLSEARDNYIETNSFLERTYRGVRRMSGR